MFCDKLFGTGNGIDMNGMPENSGLTVDWKSRLQIHGTLLKRSAQSKWLRRLFIVRDGWLLYYPETERKDMIRRNFFNIHPKAAVPLGECVISPSNEQGQNFAFTILSDDIEGGLTLAAESEFEREKWLAVLEKSKRITWANQQLSNDMIRQLEEHGQVMAKQRQDYFDRLQSEVQELAGEKERTWELERLNEELEKEKERMEAFNVEMRDEYEKVKGELEEMVGLMRTLDTEHTELLQQLDTQESDLEGLAKEKENIMATLKHAETVTEQLSQEKRETEEKMRSKLAFIEQQTSHLLQEKAEAEMRLENNKQHAKELEQEKEMYNEQAQELQATIKDLKVQKEMTEAELKDEILARLEAERRLREAESSLHHLGRAVENETPNIGSEVKEQMVVNVNKLRGFFENLAQEAKVDPDKPVVMKNAIHARKTIMRKNRTRKFERRKSSSMRAKSMNMDDVDLRGGTRTSPRRAQSTFVRSGSRDDGDDTSAPTLAPLPTLTETLTEHF